jgi:hypothetical protein
MNDVARTSVSHELDALLRHQHLANTRRVWRELVDRAQRHLWSYGDFLALLHVDLHEAMRDEPDQDHTNDHASF